MTRPGTFHMDRAHIILLSTDEDCTQVKSRHKSMSSNRRKVTTSFYTALWTENQSEGINLMLGASKPSPAVWEVSPGGHGSGFLCCMLKTLYMVAQERVGSPKSSDRCYWAYTYGGVSALFVFHFRLNDRISAVD